MYFVSGVMFSSLFYRTLYIKGGVGLKFLQLLTFCLATGSFVIFGSRIFTLYFGMPVETGQAISVINPILLLVVGLYFNYLVKNKGVKK